MRIQNLPKIAYTMSATSVSYQNSKADLPNSFQSSNTLPKHFGPTEKGRVPCVFHKQSGALS